MEKPSTVMSIDERIQARRLSDMEEEERLTKQALKQLAESLRNESKSVLNSTLNAMQKDLQEALTPIEIELSNTKTMVQRLNEQISQMELQAKTQVSNSLKEMVRQIKSSSKAALKPFNQTMKQTQREAEVVRMSLYKAWLRPFLLGLGLCLALSGFTWAVMQYLTNEIKIKKEELKSLTQSVEILERKNGALRMHWIEGKSHVSTPMNWKLSLVGKMTDSGRPVYQLLEQ